MYLIKKIIEKLINEARANYISKYKSQPIKHYEINNLLIILNIYS